MALDSGLPSAWVDFTLLQDFHIITQGDRVVAQCCSQDWVLRLLPGTFKKCGVQLLDSND